MSFSFATCEVPRAVQFIQKMYPSKEVTAEKMPLLLDLIRQDILRVQDPDFHRPCQIIAGNNYDNAKHGAAVNAALSEFKANIHNA
jgi:hypothetical protein